MIRNYYKNIFANALKLVFPDLRERDLKIDVLKPRKPEWGDVSTNAPLVIAKELKTKADDIGFRIREGLEKINENNKEGRFASKIEYTPPGFINIFFSREFVYSIIKTIFEKGERYGFDETPKDLHYLVEYVSANPTGPLHIGHGRGAVLGDVICRILKSQGYDVLREFYINDAGSQVKNLAISVVERMKEIEGKGIADIPPDGYKGEYVREIAEVLIKEKGFTFERGLSNLDYVREFAVAFMTERIKKTLCNLGVEFDSFFSEKSLYESKEVDRCISLLEEKSKTYVSDGALFLKMENNIDDKDRVLKKSDGSYTYFASDIAYHKNKYERENRRFNRIVNIWGSDHHGYISRMKGAIELLGFDSSTFIVLLVQMVRVIRDKKVVKMSKREGDFITLDEIISEVGRDATRYTFLLRKGDAQLDFDIDILKSESLNNPVYYAQYGYARICSILRKAEENGFSIPDRITPEDFNGLVLKEELDIIKKLGEYPDLLEGIANSLEPHLLVYYIQELQGMFHQYYTQYKKTEKVLSEDPVKRNGRLALIIALKTVLKNAFGLLGVDAPERMSLKGDIDEE